MSKFSISSDGAGEAAEAPVPDAPRVQTRLGFVLPSVNTVAEGWLHQVCREHASVHTARMLMPDALTAEAIERMDREDAPTAVEQLMSCRPAVVAYGCVASSIVRGAEYDGQMEEELSGHAERPCITAMGSIVRALKTLGICRVTLISPYGSAVAELESKYLKTLGFEIQNEKHFGITSTFELAAPSAKDIFDMAVANRHALSDGILLSCMNFRGHDVIEALEQALGLPVVTAVQALLWGAMRAAGLSGAVEGGGSLFRER